MSNETATDSVENSLMSPQFVGPSSPPSSQGVELPFQSTESAGPNSPPHSYRHSRAYRHFKNPPQPHMCIRVTTIAGEELFINVLSWTRIVIPQEPSDPIPLYGGMKVPPGSPRCPPLVYAVMANPEVLKDSGRHSKDPEERRAMIELMCDFVEAMNPDVKLTRNAVILKDRDISGELKDVWNAVQAQRDREREEQISQQHYHNATAQMQQIFLPSQTPHQVHQTNYNNTSTADNKVLYMEFGPESAPAFQKDQEVLEQKSIEIQSPVAVTQSAINNSENNISNSLNESKRHASDIQKTESSDIPNTLLDVTDSKTDQLSNSLTINLAHISLSQNNCNNLATKPNSNNASQIGIMANAPPITIATQPATTITPVATIAPATTTKKEKLGGFLPNGCHSIFPRFKNNKHKDKDKEKDKDSSKSSSNQTKEKTLLNSFKKSSTTNMNASNKTQLEDSKSQYDKNCINLDAEVEKLDLNRIDAPSNDVLIKLKVASSGAK